MTTMFRIVLKPNQHPIQRIMGLKLSTHMSGMEDKNVWHFTSVPLILSGVVLSRLQG
jgi:hypothetical protein